MCVERELRYLSRGGMFPPNIVTFSERSRGLTWRHVYTYSNSKDMKIVKFVKLN